MPGYQYSEKDEAKEQQLWLGIIAGERYALGSLFDIYAKPLLIYGYRICGNKELVKDAIQDVFVDIWTYRSNLAPQVRVKFYLYRSLRRAILKTIAQSERTGADTDAMESHAETQASVETDWVTSETDTQRSSRIRQSLRLLSEREREVISLKYYSDLKIREIAEMLNLKEQTIANTLQNALRKLRNSLTLCFLLCFSFLGKFF